MLCAAVVLWSLTSKGRTGRVCCMFDVGTVQEKVIVSVLFMTCYLTIHVGLIVKHCIYDT